MIVIAIGLTMAGVTMMALMPLFTKSHVDRAYDTTLSALRTYRNLAIANGARYVLIPTAPGTITVQFWPYVQGGVSPAPTTVASINLPPDVSFTTVAGFPSPGPDGFGAGNNAIYFQNNNGVADNCNIVVAGEPCIVFYPDGSAQDDAQNYINGVIYLYQNSLLSARAIDIWGTTGRVRGWRLYTPSGVATWYQQ